MATIAAIESEVPALAAPAVPKRKRAPFIFGTLVIAAAGIGGGMYVHSRGKEKTDDAQIEAHVANVAARVSGQVKRVLVSDNQKVKAGDVIVELDDADYAARVAAARADLAAATASEHAAESALALTTKQAAANVAIAKGGVAQAQAVTGSTQAMIDQARADVNAAKSRVDLARIELARSEQLASTGAAPKTELDARRAAADQADAALAQAQARVISAEANRANGSGTALAAQGRVLLADTGPEQIAAANAQVELARAKVEQAKAALTTAELNLSYTKIRAAQDGTVTKRTVEVGQIVSPDRPLMAIVDGGAPWVVANFKETQLESLHAGQRVSIEVDGFSDADLAGEVESIQAGTGSRFSLLPPDNASGNFTKVTQRVPVRIVITDAHGLTLRPGMSTTVTVFTE